VSKLGSGSEETLCVGGGGLGWQKEDRGWKQRRVKGGQGGSGAGGGGRGGGEERTVASPRAVPCWVVSSAGFSRASKQDLSLFTIRARTITFRGVSRFPPPQFSTGRYSIARPLRRQLRLGSDAASTRLRLGRESLPLRAWASIQC